MLEQACRAATVFSREGDDWVGRPLTGADLLAMPEISVNLPLDVLYAGVEFPDVPTAP